MIRPASARPLATSSGISSNASSLYANSPSTIRSTRNAVVSAPGTTISIVERSWSDRGSRATTMGP